MTTVSGIGNEDKMTDLEVRLKYRKSEKDDWTKVEDKALRKKIQNRLAKRKSRINGPKERTKKEYDRPKTSREASDIAETSEDGATMTESGTPSTDSTDDVSDRLRKETFFNIASLRNDADSTIRSFLANRGLAEHRYISLMQYSVIRAFIQNAEMLAIDPYLIADDDALSPWTISHPYPALIPHDISPTPLQLSTPHHPYLDMIASPSLRDNVLLLITTDEQQDQLCYDMHSGSFTIWGSQPWNAIAWEISQTFVTNWPWLVEDEMIRCSNFWRAERGEGPLVVPNLSGSVLGEIL